MQGEWISSQIELHREYGGVVPDLAAREHGDQLILLWENCLRQFPHFEAERVAVTTGPGLAGCLSLGIAFAKSLALSWNVPLSKVNHLKAHAVSPFIPLHEFDPEAFHQSLQKLFPHLGLIVSGGNTILFAMDNPCSIRVVAETVDDALGEALDKGSKLLGLPYPGGPEMERYANKGNPRAFDFPVSCRDPEDHRFSFSGLKTSLRYRLEKMDDNTFHSSFNDLCAAYQEAAFLQTSRKVEQAMERENFASFGLSGGVSNNRELTLKLTQITEQYQIPFLPAQRQHTGDNAGMIAFTAWWEEAIEGIAQDQNPNTLGFDPSWPLI